MQNSVGLGATILRFALAFLLIVTGVWGISGNASLFSGITSLFSGSARNIIAMVLAIAALIAGVLLIVELFTGGFPIVDLILMIFTILWLVQIVLSVLGQLGSAFSSSANLLKFLHSLSYDLLVLAALLISQKNFN